MTPDLLRLWDRMEITDPDRFPGPLAAIRASHARYEAVAARTLVPWQVIGVLHMREAGGDFRCHLHNGDPLAARTVHVPRGRPLVGDPPFTWEESAQDALATDDLAGKRDWSLVVTLDRIERFNGIGYRRMGIPSPYLWAGTNHYLGGKYTADGVFDPKAWDKQPGAAALLKLLHYGYA